MKLRLSARSFSLWTLLVGGLGVGSYASANWVSGTISVNGEPYSGMLTLPNGTELPIQGGQFRVFLVPGTYSLSITTKEGRRQQFTVTSDPLLISNLTIKLP